jgi:hypothetical protein
MAINQITTANTFTQWVDATRALIVTANALTNGVQFGQRFSMNTAIEIDGVGAFLDVKTNAHIEVLSANSVNINGAPLLVFSTITVPGQSNIVANSPSGSLKIANGYGVNIETNAANDTITFSVPQDYAIGYTGSAGPAGSQGATGFTGSAGTNGSAGATGFTGSKGDIGYTGSKGDTGLTGSVGFTGSQGDAGAAGATGFTGSAGSGYLGIPQNRQTAEYTLVIGDSGKHISTTSNVRVPNSVFANGDAITIYNNSSSPIRLIENSNTTIRLAGTNQTGSRNIANYGLVTIICVDSAARPNVFVASGVGLY